MFGVVDLAIDLAIDLGIDLYWVWGREIDWWIYIGFGASLYLLDSIL